MKKSLAAGIVAAQPSLLSGILKAQGGGGGTGTTDPWGGTDLGGTTDFVGTVADWETYQTAWGQTTDVGTTTSMQWILVGEAYSGGEICPFDQAGYSETNPHIDAWEGFKFKANFWAAPASAQGDSVTLQVAGEVYGNDWSETTPRISLQANLVDPSTSGAIEAMLLPPEGEVNPSPYHLWDI